jgi:hypothetical protein
MLVAKGVQAILSVVVTGLAVVLLWSYSYGFDAAGSLLKNKTAVDYTCQSRGEIEVAPYSQTPTLVQINNADIKVAMSGACGLRQADSGRYFCRATGCRGKCRLNLVPLYCACD